MSKKTFIKWTSRVVILLTLTIPLLTFGQLETDSVNNYNYELTDNESNHLNQAFLNSRGDFDFKGKKIGFAIGSSNYKLRSKKEYFDEFYNFQAGGSHIVDLLIILTNHEKIDSNGFDAIIISWSKTGVSDKTKRKLIYKLKANT